MRTDRCRTCHPYRLLDEARPATSRATQLEITLPAGVGGPVLPVPVDAPPAAGADKTPAGWTARSQEALFTMRRDWSPVLARLRRRPRADLPLTERGRLLVEEYLQLRADQQAPDYRKNARPTFAAKVPEQEKVRVVEEFTRDELVATTAATSLLRRPDVAFRAMGDDTARHQVNHAQVERGRQAREHFEETSPVAPAIRNIDRSVEFLKCV